MLDGKHIEQQGPGAYSTKERDMKREGDKDEEAESRKAGEEREKEREGDKDEEEERGVER